MVGWAAEFIRDLLEGEISGEAQGFPVEVALASSGENAGLVRRSNRQGNKLLSHNSGMFARQRYPSVYELTYS